MKALSVFSGGLDSMLASELIRAQGINVLAVFFETPFFDSRKAKESALSMELPFKVINITDRHLEIVKSPKYGYGGNMNPCIDCHALMFRIAGEMLVTEGADFVVTGEVLGQRPMSQNKKSFVLLNSESGLERLLLRPLSARRLPPTLPEERGWVNRELLMDFQGRSRKPQITLAERLNIKKYPSPGGGCLLTEKAFSERLKDLFSHASDKTENKEIELLKLGRHFRISSTTKLVVGRNRKENEDIRALSGDQDLILSCISVPGPSVLASGEISDTSLNLAAEITASYSDAASDSKVDIKVTGKGTDKVLRTGLRDKKEFKHYML